jgi:prephenate dehydrogenase
MVGLGLIGGSVGRAAVAAGWSVRAWTPSGEGPRRAARDGIEPADRLEGALRDADLVVLAAPPLACLELLDRLAAEPARSSLAPDAVVTDVASTKRAIVERARSRELRFVGGHPLAGRETSGYDASDPDLFRDRPWVIVPPEPADDEAEARVVALAEVCGARPVRATAAEHDRAVAAISHLLLVVSAALVETAANDPDWAMARDLAAGGWASMTRLARGDPTMGAGILATNAAEIADRLRALSATVDAWAADLEGPDVGRRTGDRLARARAALETEEP